MGREFVLNFPNLAFWRVLPRGKRVLSHGHSIIIDINNNWIAYFQIAVRKQAYLDRE